MGMAIVETLKLPKPSSEHTTVCPGCWAEYSKDRKWVRGYYSNPRGDTSNPTFVETSKVPAGCCPLCLTPNVAIEGPEQAQLANGPARMES